MKDNSHNLKKYSEKKFKIIDFSLSLNSAIALMKQEQVSCLLIESQLKLTGIITESNLIKLICLKKDLNLLNAEQVMTQNPVVLNVNANLSSAEIAGLFQHHQTKYLPLVNTTGRGVGLITPSSLLSNLDLQDINSTINLLNDVDNPDYQQPAAEKVIEERQKQQWKITQLENQNQQLKTENQLLQKQLKKEYDLNKSVFLKEIHHRIKNNLQVISALLDLQSEQITDQAASTLLEKSQARIQTMALIYEKLYSSSNTEQIDFADYITSLTQYLYDYFIEDYKQIELILNIEPLQLSIDLATPCGLIINELVTNSLQHGFKQQTRGKIQINFSLNSNHQYSLQIADNGSGINPQTEIKNNSEFLGISMVKSLVTEQLKGTWKNFSSNGCITEITFPPKS